MKFPPRLEKIKDKIANPRSFTLVAFVCLFAVIGVHFLFASHADPLTPDTNGLHVSGDELLDASGNIVHMHGVDLSGSEYACIQGWGIFSGNQNTAQDVAAMKAWNINFVRIQLNEDCWLGINTTGLNSSYIDTSAGVGPYATAIENLVTLLHQNGIYTEIVDMWNAPGTDPSVGQSGSISSGANATVSGTSITDWQGGVSAPFVGEGVSGGALPGGATITGGISGSTGDWNFTVSSSAGSGTDNLTLSMNSDAYYGPDADHSTAMWTSMAQTFANDPDTILSPAGEEDVSMACQMNGCSNEGLAPTNVDGLGAGSYNGGSGYFYNVAGLNSAVSTMRANGYDGPIALECSAWGSTCTSWVSDLNADTISPSQIMAEVHNYSTGSCTTISCWETQYLPVLQAGYPLFYGELGSANTGGNCGTSYPAESTSWADAYGIGYMYWTWTANNGDCFTLPTDYSSGVNEAPPTAASFTGTTAVASTSITSVSSTSGLAIGQVVTGTGLPAGDTIISISGSTITMGLESTAAASGVSLTAEEAGAGWVKAHLQSFTNAPAQQKNISSGQPTYANAGATNNAGGGNCNASDCFATDGTYDSSNGGADGEPGTKHLYECDLTASTGNPCYVDVNVSSTLPSSCNSSGTCKIAVAFYGGSAANWEETVDGGGEAYVYNIPGNYEIDACSTSCTGTPPTSGWTTLSGSAVTGNTVSSDVTPVLSVPANTKWIRFYDTAPSPADASGNQDLLMNMDILSVPTSLPVGSTDTDSWLFLGDSVTQYSMSIQEPTNFMQTINTAQSQYYPVEVDGGIGSDDASNELTGVSPITSNTYFQDALNSWKGHYIALDYGGTESVSGNCSAFLNNQSTMVAGVVYSGFQPVMRYSVSWTSDFSAGATSTAEEVNQTIAGPAPASGTCGGDGQTFLFSRYPSMIVGPDIWGFFTEDNTFPTSTPYENNNTGPGSTNVHPTHPAGENAYRGLYTTTLLDNIYSDDFIPDTPTANISANPTSITSGGSGSTLSWSSTNTSSCTASSSPTDSNFNGTVSTSGSITVNPTSTTTYTINCPGSSSGSASANSTLTVNTAPAPTVNLSASPAIVDLAGAGSSGASSTLTWSSSSATSCSATSPSSWTTSTSTSGIQSVSPGSTTTYTIACTGTGGTTDATATVTAGPTGDLNNDGVVNIFDLSILLSRWGQSGTGLAGDLNSDNIVNIFDLSILLSHWQDT